MDCKIKILQKELHLFEAKTKQEESTITSTERFLLKIINKLNHFIDYQQAALANGPSFSFNIDPDS